MTKDSGRRRIGRAAVDWDKLRDRIHWGVRFLDDVIDVNSYPLESIRAATTGNRKIGLGVMGFADLLIRLGIPYTSREAVDVRGQAHALRSPGVSGRVRETARAKGVSSRISKSRSTPKDDRKLRNATVNTIAPTGTISIIAGCSSGIEPLFAVSFVRNVLSGTRLFETQSALRADRQGPGLLQPGAAGRSGEASSLATIKGIPSDVKRLFVTAFDVAAASASGDPGGLSAIHRQRRLQDDQSARRRDRRGRPRHLPGGPSPQVQGHHDLPLRLQARPGPLRERGGGIPARGIARFRRGRHRVRRRLHRRRLRFLTTSPSLRPSSQ